MIPTGILEDKYTRSNIFIETYKSIISLGEIRNKASYESINEPWEYGTSVFRQLTDIEEAKILMEYKFTNIDEAFEYIRENGFLLPILLQAKDEIKKYFPLVEPNDLLIEVHSDPEDRTRILSLTIFVDMKSVEALAQLNKLRYDWWLDVIMQNRELNMVIDVNFK